MGDKQVNINNARDGIYKNVIEKIASDGVCPFCKEHLSSIHPNPLDERGYWIVTDNAYPYKAKKEHLLLIHKVHITNINEITPPAWKELHEIIIEESKKRSIEGGTFLFRFGNTGKTGASVQHLHCQLFEPDTESPEYDPSSGVLIRIG